MLNTTLYQLYLNQKNNIMNFFIFECTKESILIFRIILRSLVQFSSIAQSCPTLCDSMNTAHQASLPITNSQSLPKLMSIVMPSNHLTLYSPLLPLSIFLNIRVFSNESALLIRWPKYGSFSFNISINSSALSFLYDPILTSIHDYWKNHSFDYMDLCWQSNFSAF